MHGVTPLARKAKTARPPTYGRMTQALQDAEKQGLPFLNEDGRTVYGHGTGATILKMRGPPIVQLLQEAKDQERGVKNTKKPVDGERFGAQEFQAAQEIETAFFAISGGLMLKPMSYERVDRGHSAEWSASVAAKVNRYQAWARHWSDMAKLFDPTLEIIIAAVIDQRGIRQIAEDLGYGHNRIRNAIVRGLRDYAARAGWAAPRVATEWKARAGQTFRRAAIMRDAEAVFSK